MPEELMDSSNALGYLRQEHETISSLIETCEGDYQADLIENAKLELVRELKMLDLLEVEFFIPFASSYVSKDMMEKHADSNIEIAMLTKKLEKLGPRDQDFFPVLADLISKFQHHVYQEEQFVFLNMEGKHPDVHNDLIILANLMKRRRVEMLKTDEQNRRSKAALVGDGAPVRPMTEASSKLDSDTNLAGTPVEYDGTLPKVSEDVVYLGKKDDAYLPNVEVARKLGEAHAGDASHRGGEANNEDYYY